MLSSPRESIIFLPFGFEGFTVSAPHPEFRFFQINRSNARIDHPFDLLLLHVTDETLSRHNIGDQVPVRNLPPLAVALALFEVIFHPIPFSKKIILIISPGYPCHKLDPVPFVSPRLNALLKSNAFLIQRSVYHHGIGTHICFRFPRLCCLEIRFCACGGLRIDAATGQKQTNQN